MNTPVDEEGDLPALGKELAKQWKAKTLSDPPTLISILNKFGFKDSRVVKQKLLAEFGKVVGKKQANQAFDEIFKKGKPHKSADGLRDLGSELGEQWQGGKREGWEALLSIMEKYYVEKRPIALKYILEGMQAILGKEAAKIALRRIFSRVPQAEAIRQKGRELAQQWKDGTLTDPQTLAELAQLFKVKNTGTVRKFLLEGNSEILGENEAALAYAEIFQYSIRSDIAETLRQEGHELAENWNAKTLSEYPTLASFMQKY